MSDFNGDGISDLVSANGGSHTASVLLGNGDGTFQARQDVTTGSGTFGHVAVGDFNGDGVKDLAAQVASSVADVSQEAEARITDADTAENSAALVRTRILQQASSAILAQANQQPTLALTLLRE